MGEKSPLWKGGRYVARLLGYIFIKRPDHPNADKRGYVREHVFLMSEHLGRPIAKHEVVHHINDIKDDNRIENLRLMTRAEHHSLHHKGLVKPESLKNLVVRNAEEWKAYRALHPDPRQKPPKICKHCGIEFRRKHAPHQIYCSLKCRFAKPPH